MLRHVVVGPTREGRYLVAYITPGCQNFTAVDDCPSESVARAEVLRRNQAQLDREETIRADARARGLYHIYPDLKGK